MVNVVDTRRCDVEGCSHRPRYGYWGSRPCRCRDHASLDMSNLVDGRQARTCASRGCGARLCPEDPELLCPHHATADALLAFAACAFATV